MEKDRKCGVEITHEMIDAGVDAYLELCPELSLPPCLSARDLVRQIIFASLRSQNGHEE